MTDQPPTRGQLLLRRAMRPDEWGESYLADLLRLNGIRRPWIYDVDRVRENLPWYTSADLASHSLDKLTLQRARDGRPRYGSFNLPGWASLHRSVATRYCPMCLAQSRHIRTRWRIPLLPVCTEHGCHLKTDLAEPALTTQYKFAKYRYLHSVSDEQILEDAVGCMPDEFSAVTSVWAPLERAAESSSQPYADDALGELAGWSVLAWRLLERVARDHCRQVLQRTSSGTLRDIAQMLGDTGLSIASNEPGVLGFLRGLKSNVHSLAADRCLRALIAAEAREVSVLSQLPLATLHDALSAAAPQMTVTTRPGQRLFEDERNQSLSRLQAIDYLGVGEKVVDDWIRTRRLPRVTVHKAGRKRFIFIDRSDLKRARRYMLSLVYVEDFLTEQGVDWPVYFALRKEGILEPVQIGDRRYLHRDEVAALASRLETVSAPAAEHDGQTYPVFDQSTVDLAGRQETFAAFVQAALDGLFAVYRSLDRPGLSAFRVGPEALAWLRARRAVDRARNKAPHADHQLDLLGATA